MSLSNFFVSIGSRLPNNRNINLKERRDKTCNNQSSRLQRQQALQDKQALQSFHENKRRQRARQCPNSKKDLQCPACNVRIQRREDVQCIQCISLLHKSEGNKKQEGKKRKTCNDQKRKELQIGTRERESELNEIG